MTEAPADFVCPITLESSSGPYAVTCVGQVYDEAALCEWFASGRTTDSVTNVDLGDNHFVVLASCGAALDAVEERRRRREPHTETVL